MISLPDDTQYVYDESAADRAVEFFANCLTHVKNNVFAKAKSPFILAPWQEDTTRKLFGWVDPLTGYRRYRHLICFVPRKQGKTTWIAGLTLYGLLCDHEDGAECYSGATSRDQSGLLFEIMAGFIRQNEMLSIECKIIQYHKRIEIPKTGSYFRALAADAARVHGTNPHFAVCDEIHEWKNGDLYETLRTGTGGRPQPLLTCISTAGAGHYGFAWDQYSYAKNLLAGRIKDDQVLPVIFEADEDDAWDEESTWIKANPSYGISIDPKYIARECNRAKNDVSYQNVFRRLHLNQWTSTDVRYFDMKDWRSCDEYSVAT